MPTTVEQPFVSFPVGTIRGPYRSSNGTQFMVQGANGWVPLTRATEHEAREAAEAYVPQALLTAYLTAHPVSTPTNVECFTYGVGERRIRRWVAFTSTFKVVAHLDPVTNAVVKGEVPFESYASV